MKSQQGNWKVDDMSVLREISNIYTTMNEGGGQPQPGGSNDVFVDVSTISSLPTTDITTNVLNTINYNTAEFDAVQKRFCDFLVQMANRYKTPITFHDCVLIEYKINSVINGIDCSKYRFLSLIEVHADEEIELSAASDDFGKIICLHPGDGTDIHVLDTMYTTDGELIDFRDDFGRSEVYMFPFINNPDIFGTLEPEDLINIDYTSEWLSRTNSMDTIVGDYFDRESSDGCSINDGIVLYHQADHSYLAQNGNYVTEPASGTNIFYMISYSSINRPLVIDELAAKSTPNSHIKLYILNYADNISLYHGEIDNSECYDIKHETLKANYISVVEIINNKISYNINCICSDEISAWVPGEDTLFTYVDDGDYRSDNLVITQEDMQHSFNFIYDVNEIPVQLTNLITSVNNFRNWLKLYIELPNKNAMWVFSQSYHEAFLSTPVFIPGNIILTSAKFLNVFNIFTVADNDTGESDYDAYVIIKEDNDIILYQRKSFYKLIHTSNPTDFASWENITDEYESQYIHPAELSSPDSTSDVRLCFDDGGDILGDIKLYVKRNLLPEAANDDYYIGDPLLAYNGFTSDWVVKSTHNEQQHINYGNTTILVPDLLMLRNGIAIDKFGFLSDDTLYKPLINFICNDTAPYLTGKEIFTRQNNNPISSLWDAYDERRYLLSMPNERLAEYNKAFNYRYNNLHIQFKPVIDSIPTYKNYIVFVDSTNRIWLAGNNQNYNDLTDASQYEIIKTNWVQYSEYNISDNSLVNTDNAYYIGLGVDGDASNTCAVFLVNFMLALYGKGAVDVVYAHDPYLNDTATRTYVEYQTFYGGYYVSGLHCSVKALWQGIQSQLNYNNDISKSKIKVIG